MKLLLEIDIPEESFASFTRVSPPPPGWTEDRVRHCVMRAIIAGIGKSVLFEDFEFDREVHGMQHGTSYCVRRLVS